jgi:hypothetical protein
MFLPPVNFCLLILVLCLISIGAPATTQETKPDPRAPRLHGSCGHRVRVVRGAEALLLAHIAMLGEI